MKSRVTLSLEQDYVEYLDQLAVQWGRSRSATLTALILEHLQRHKREELAAQARKFFALPESEAETNERIAWERAGFEVLAHEDDDPLATAR
jgi:metal-responsive CopG/Arc/MetJ family transcriptional regulator